MDIIKVTFDKMNLSITVNLLGLIVIAVIVVAVIAIANKVLKFAWKKSIDVSEVELGVGDSKVKLSYNRKDQEIAYKIWVELTTRKIGMKFDDQNDVILEVYDSWYQFFATTRELIKEIPASKFEYSSELIQLSCKVLNEGLRPHLTHWQARFRKWYDNALKDSENRNPQDIQREYPQYEELVKDLKETNEHMIKYAELMKTIAFGK